MFFSFLLVRLIFFHLDIKIFRNDGKILKMNWLLSLIISITAVTYVWCISHYLEGEIRKYVESNYWKLRKNYQKNSKPNANKELQNEYVDDYSENTYIVYNVIVPEEGSLNITLDGIHFFISPGALECTTTDKTGNKLKVLTLVTSIDGDGKFENVINIRKHGSQDYYVHPDVIRIMKLKKTYSEQDFETMKNWYKTKQITKDLEKRISATGEVFSINMGPFLLDLKGHGMVTIPGVLLIETPRWDNYFIVEAVEENETWIELRDEKYIAMGKPVFALM